MKSPFPARQAEPNQLFNHHEADTGEVEMRAGADGILRPQTIAEHRLAEAFRIPVADGEEPYTGPLYFHDADNDDEPADAAAGPSKAELVARARELGIASRGTKAALAASIEAAETTNRTGGAPESTGASE